MIDAHTAALLEVWREECREQCRSLRFDLANDAFVFSLAPDFSTPLVPNSVTTGGPSSSPIGRNKIKGPHRQSEMSLAVPRGD